MKPEIKLTTYDWLMLGFAALLTLGSFGFLCWVVYCTWHFVRKFW